MTTENGAPSLLTTGSKRINLFFKLVRDVTGNHESGSFIWLLNEAFEEEPLDTLKILFHGRDCRGGKGDRKPFLAAMQHLWRNQPAWFLENFREIPTFGRWLDLFELLVENQENQENQESDRDTEPLIDLIVETLKSDMEKLNSGEFGISLLAKWFPSEGHKWDRRPVRDLICARLFTVTGVTGVTKHHYRRLRKEVLTPLREHLKIVESQMCAGGWHHIEYGHVPSVAMSRLRKAFVKHDEPRFKEWLSEVKSGEKKIHADQLYPHDIVRHFLGQKDDEDDADQVLEVQWSAIVEKYRPLIGEESIAIADVSGSMAGTPLEVSIALGLLIATVSKQPLITFSEHPEIHEIRANSLREQIKEIEGMDWGGNTNFEAVFELLLTLPNPPKRLFVFSDMQFDQAMGIHMSRSSSATAATTFERMRQRYREAERPFPSIVFWNLRCETEDFPTEQDERGVALVSGFSPSLLTSVLSDDFSPYGVMRQAIDNSRYDCIRAPLT